ncbi:MAG: hypothetical protein WD491_01110 [Balneolales bacterium]
MIKVKLQQIQSQRGFSSLNRAALLCILLYLPLIANGNDNDSPQELFNRGNFYLEQSKFPEALDIYRNIEQKEYISGPLYLNMAISYVNVDSLGMAKYYFLKAGEYSATKAKGDEGVALIERRLQQQRGTLPRLGWISFNEWLYFDLSVTMVLLSGLLLFNIGLIFIVAAWFSNFQRSLKYSGVTFFAIGALLVLFSIIIDSQSKDYNRAVMIEARTSLRSHPSEDNDAVATVYEGYTFTLHQNQSRQYEGWEYIRLSNGLYGWIEEKAIRRL